MSGSCPLGETSLLLDRINARFLQFFSSLKSAFDPSFTGVGLSPRRGVQMLNTAKLVAFAPIRDSQPSRAFYEGILGLQFVSDDPFALVMNSNGTILRLSKGANFTPAEFTVLGWGVSVIEEAVTGLQKKSVVFEKFPGLGQNELGIWTAPGGAKVAWFKDPDGNILSVSQHS